MFAVVANGIQTICRTQRALNTIIAIYPYPKFQKCATFEEANEWLRRNARGIHTQHREFYGNVCAWGYARIEYFIVDGKSYYNIYTNKVGYLRIEPSEHVSVDNRRELIKVRVSDTVLDDNKIQHHIIAIHRIMKLLGNYIDIDVIVPDTSIYLALTSYKGKDHVIRSLQRTINQRLGGFSVTVRDKYLTKI